MLFVLPPAIVPLVVVAALALDRLPDVLAGRLHPQRLLWCAGDAWFAVGPALVFVLADVGEPSLARLADLPARARRAVRRRAVQLDAARVARPRRRAEAAARRPARGLARRRAAVADRPARRAREHRRSHYAYLLVAAARRCCSPSSRASAASASGTAIELSATYRGTALLLGDVLSDDDEYTGTHSQGVVVLALAIADELGIDEDERRLVEFGAMLHDIGKMTTPQEILHKPGPLTDEEWETMRRHTIDGQRMLDRSAARCTTSALVVRSSHERYDGGGYPDALARRRRSRSPRASSRSPTRTAR